MEQFAEFCISSIPASAFDTVAAEVNRYFDQIEDKPLYFDRWFSNLLLSRDKGSIQMYSDVHADYWEYRDILPGLARHLAKNIPNTPLKGYYLQTDQERFEETHNFDIAADGQISWTHEGCEDDEDLEDFE